MFFGWFVKCQSVFPWRTPHNTHRMWSDCNEKPQVFDRFCCCCCCCSFAFPSAHRPISFVSYPNNILFFYETQNKRNAIGARRSYYGHSKWMADFNGTNSIVKEEPEWFFFSLCLKITKQSNEITVSVLLIAHIPKPECTTAPTYTFLLFYSILTLLKTHSTALSILPIIIIKKKNKNKMLLFAPHSGDTIHYIQCMNRI